MEVLRSCSLKKKKSHKLLPSDLKNVPKTIITASSVHHSTATISSSPVSCLITALFLDRAVFAHDHDLVGVWSSHGHLMRHQDYCFRLQNLHGHTPTQRAVNTRHKSRDGRWYSSTLRHGFQDIGHSHLLPLPFMVCQVHYTRIDQDQCTGYSLVTKTVPVAIFVGFRGVHAASVRICCSMASYGSRNTLSGSLKCKHGVRRVQQNPGTGLVARGTNKQMQIWK